MERNTTFSTETKSAGGGGSASALYGTLADREISAVRVNQLDAGVLDVELHGLLKTQLGRACIGLPSGTLERFKPEVDALFNLLLFRFTIWLQRPTPGMHLQGLRYRNDAYRETPVAGMGADFTQAGSAAPPVLSTQGPTGGGGGGGGGAIGDGLLNAPGSSVWTLPYSGDAPTRTQRLLHGLLSVGVQWAFARLRRHGLVHGWSGEEAGSARRFIWHTMRRLENLFRVAWMVNLLLFLRHGKYPTPVDRLLQMRMVHDRVDPGPRSINYQFLNRRLLWDHWAKMAYVVTPLINWGSIRRAVVGGAGRLRREARAFGIVGDGGGGGGGGRHRGAGGGGTAVRDADGVALTACADCGVDPAKTPYVTSCGHVFCYYCARTACTVDPRYACPRCGEHFATSRRWSQPR